MMNWTLGVVSGVGRAVVAVLLKTELWMLSR